MRAYIGIGSNLGDRNANLQESINKLGETEGIRVVKVSPVYETIPVGGPKQPDYLNAAAKVDTSLDAMEFMSVCMEIENAMGRTRNELWGPRIIDIDLLLYGADCLQTEKLTVPHPRMHERAFVLKPLADIAPEALHPLSGKTVDELLKSVDCTGVTKFDSFVLRY